MIREIGKITPRWVKRFIRGHFNVTAYDLDLQRKENEYYDLTESLTNNAHSPYTFGIIKEFYQNHRCFIAACLEMGVPFKALDISGSDWIEVIKNSGCEVFLVWPTAVNTVWRTMFDERVAILSSELGKVVYPAPHELWLYESKRRTRDWLVAHEIPHPKTWIFYNFPEMAGFIETCDLPIVYKTNLGASAHGVKILRERSAARKFLTTAFRKGFTPERGDPRDRQWGSVLLQEYLPDVREWRMVRIGDAFFGHLKGRVGDFHSGSGAFSWDVPSKELLDFLRQVTDVGKFTSMDVDVFETKDGRFLVNELQTVFGASHSVDQLRVDGVAGRFIYKTGPDEYQFEAGDFARNACANARIQYVIDSRLAG